MEDMGDASVIPELSETAISNSRRSSMGTTCSSNSREKPVPRYLRASTGSCHDICKYGKQHTFEAKVSLPMSRRVTRKSLEGGSSTDSIVLPREKKITLAQAKAKYTLVSRSSEANATTFKRQEEVSVKSPICRGPVQREVLDIRKKELAKPRASQLSRSHTTNAPKTSKQEASSATRNSEDFKKEFLLKALESKLPEKSDKILKPRTMKVKPLRSTGSFNSRNNDYSKTGKSFRTSKEVAKKVVAPSPASLPSDSVHRVVNLTARKHSNLKAIPLKNHNKVRRSKPEQVQSDEVQEKTLYVIKVENEERSEQSLQNETNDNIEAVASSPKSSLAPTSPSFLLQEDDQDHGGFEYTDNEAEDDSYSDGDEFGNMEEEEETVSEISKGRSKKLGAYRSNEKDNPSVKLNFSRGKIIDVRSENNSPRRLKFRRGRVLGDSQKVTDGHRKSFKKGQEIDCDTISTEAASETVVLRHQDVQGKKDSQGLLNNVIEETASKLVETRKSKVKALVGAFETVISLQDGKPSLDTVM